MRKASSHSGVAGQDVAPSHDAQPSGSADTRRHENFATADPARVLDRRHWLRSVAGGAAIASVARSLPVFRSATGSLLAAEPARPATGVTFGFSLYGMRALGLEQALKTCGEIGYDAVELVTMDGWPCDPAIVTAELQKSIEGWLTDAGLSVTCLMENLSVLGDDAVHRKNLDRLKKSAEFGQAISPAAPPVIETILGGKPDRWEADKRRMADRLAEWARVGEAAKTVIAVKPHVAGALHTPEGALWLMKQLDSRWLRVVYDFSHYRLRGLDLKETLRELLPFTVFIHIKDAEGTPSAFRFSLPGEGETDYRTYFEELKTARWAGSVVVEVSGQLHTKAGYDGALAARKSYAAIAPRMEAAELRTSRIGR